MTIRELSRHAFDIYHIYRRQGRPDGIIVTRSILDDADGSKHFLAIMSEAAHDSLIEESFRRALEGVRNYKWVPGEGELP